MNENTPIQKGRTRIVFIDLLRAYAILMMVQGHAIDAFLSYSYRNPDNIIYSIWNTLRGVTAPTFFFSSGAIFTYLLLSNNSVFSKNIRVKKGIKRFIMLLTIGYLFRFNPVMLLDIFHLNAYDYKAFFAVDALHCIGFGLLIIIALYYISRILKFNLVYLLLIAGLFVFISYPIVARTNWTDFLPLPFADYLTSDFGSNFPLAPWIGFVFFGSMLGCFLFKYNGIYEKVIFSPILLGIGIIITFFTGLFFDILYQLTNIYAFYDLAFNNFLFFRLGQVMILAGIISLIARYRKNIPKILPKIGQKTLMIYIVHIFIIYGTALNYGLKDFIGYKLNLTYSIISALILIIFFILLVNYTENIKNFFLKFPFFKKN